MNATYINASQFSVTEGVPGNEIGIGQWVVCDLGTDGELRTTVTATSINSETGVTTVTVSSTALTANLVSILRGPTFNDRTTHVSNIAPHYHEWLEDGGEMPASRLLDNSTVDRLNSLAGVSPYVAGLLLGVNLTGDGVTKYDIAGVSNRTSVSKAGTVITVTTPQDSHVGASPEYAGLKLSGLHGLLVADDTTGQLSAVLPSAGNKVVRRNVANTGFDTVDFLLASLGDVALGGTPQQGQAVVVGNDLKFTLGYPAQAGSTTTIGGVTIGLVFALSLLMQEA